MPSLLELQRSVRDALLTDQPGAASAWIRADGVDRLAVYRNTIAGACAHALGLAFPTVARLVGHEFFAGAAGIFALAERPVAADLCAYGSGFPAFLQGFAPCAGLAYLPDVARLDWVVHQCLHAPDGPPIALERLAGLDQAAAASLRLGLHPAVGLLRSAHPVDAIWQAVLAQDDAALAAVDLASGPVHLLVERTDDGPRVLRQSEAQWLLASGLAQGRAFGELVEQFGAADAPALLARHLMAGHLVASTRRPEGIAS